MSNIKHTPGPWKYHIGLDYILIESANVHNNSCICEYKNYSDDDGESEANAKLLAAAPELFEALKELTSLAPDHSLLPTDFDNDLMNAVKKAEAAIQKATV